MGYRPKPLGDRLNRQRAAAFAAPRKTTCPWCSVNGHGYHTLTLTADHTRLVCPRCGDGRAASEDERRVYGGEPERAA